MKLNGGQKLLIGSVFVIVATIFACVFRYHDFRSYTHTEFSKSDLTGLLNEGVRGREALEKRARAKDMQSKRLLANGYMFGVGLEKDEEKAFELFTDLAETGDSDSMMKLGFFYKSGLGNQSKSYKKAYSCYIQALDEIGGKAALAICGLYKSGDNDFPADPVKEKEWAVKAEEMLVSEGSEEAYYTLGIAYKGGHDLKGNDARSFMYFEKAAQMGHVSSMIAVARAYYNGDGIELDKEFSRRWLDDAAAVRGDEIIDIFLSKYPKSRQKEIREWYGKGVTLK